ncbi:hypothetical protein BDW62DRAFT_197107 [Aspergillus aurantiobrunneus]
MVIVRVIGDCLTIGTFALIARRLGDDFGHKKIIIGMSWYSFWTLVCGLAVYSTQVLFIFARVFQDMGPALTLPNAIAILGQSYTPGPRKIMAFAFFGGSLHPLMPLLVLPLAASLRWLGGRGRTGPRP